MLHLENPINILIGGYFEGDINWRSSYHKSDDCYKLYYIMEGDLWIEDGDGRHELSKDRIYLLNGHKILRYGTESRFEVHWLHFVPQNIATNRALYTLPTIVELPHNILLSALYDEVYCGKSNIYSFRSYSAKYKLILHSHIQSVILEALRGYEWELDSAANTDCRIDRAVEFIHTNLNQNISLADIAAACHLSPSYLHKLFSTTLHTTPANYMTQLKMNRALSLISQNLSVKEISYELGYCNDAHFSRTFKQFYGFSPKIFRSDNLLNNALAKQLRDNVNEPL